MSARNPKAVQEEQYLHLVRLAWDLRQRGLGTAVNLPRAEEPSLMVPRAAEPLRIRALLHDGTWLFTWGRSKASQVRALANDAADRIEEAAK